MPVPLQCDEVLTQVGAAGCHVSAYLCEGITFVSVGLSQMVDIDRDERFGGIRAAWPLGA
jgi:hypothetical protein